MFRSADIPFSLFHFLYSIFFEKATKIISFHDYKETVICKRRQYDVKLVRLFQRKRHTLATKRGNENLERSFRTVLVLSAFKTINIFVSYVIEIETTIFLLSQFVYSLLNILVILSIFEGLISKNLSQLKL